MNGGLKNKESFEKTIYNMYILCTNVHLMEGDMPF